MIVADFRKINKITQVSHVRNTAYRAHEGDGKSLPRGEGFRVRVTYKKARWAYSLPTIDNPQIRTNVQQV